MPRAAGPSNQNWVDRWSPRSFEDLIGNASAMRWDLTVEGNVGFNLWALDLCGALDPGVLIQIEVLDGYNVGQQV